MKLLLVVAGCLLIVPMVAEAAQPVAQRDMVLVPAGEFTMGTSEEEANRLSQHYGVHPTHFLTEAPQRKVHVEAFYIDRHPVTNAQYKQFTDAMGRRPS